MLLKKATVYKWSPCDKYDTFKSVIDKIQELSDKPTFRAPTSIIEHGSTHRIGFGKIHEHLNEYFIDSPTHSIVMFDILKKSVPASAVKARIKELIKAHLETSGDTKIGKTLRATFKEQARDELLAQAITTTTQVPVILADDLLIMGTSSATAATDILAYLRVAMQSLAVELDDREHDVVAFMADAVANTLEQHDDEDCQYDFYAYRSVSMCETDTTKLVTLSNFDGDNMLLDSLSNLYNEGYQPINTTISLPNTHESFTVNINCVFTNIDYNVSRDSDIDENNLYDKLMSESYIVINFIKHVFKLIKGSAL